MATSVESTVVEDIALAIGAGSTVVKNTTLATGAGNTVVGNTDRAAVTRTTISVVQPLELPTQMAPLPEPPILVVCLKY